MLRNKSVFLTLVAILAVASFGFTSYNAVSFGGANSTTSSDLFLTTSQTPQQVCDGDKDFDDNLCGGLTNTSPFIWQNAALAKVSPQLAGFCALFKQPAGTTVASVSDLFPGSYPPYYKVTLDGANGNPVVYVNAINCNTMPAP
jgi:hypothetical protein